MTDQTDAPMSADEKKAAWEISQDVKASILLVLLKLEQKPGIKIDDVGVHSAASLGVAEALGIVLSQYEPEGQERVIQHVRTAAQKYTTEFEGFRATLDADPALKDALDKSFDAFAAAGYNFDALKNTH